MEKTRILIVDDNKDVLYGLKIILELENFEITGLCTNAKEAIEFLEKRNADVVLMDIRMPVMDGIEGTFNIKVRFPNVRVIILTTFCEEDYIKKSLSFGADGYILKSSDAQHIIDTIYAVLDGKVVIDKEIALFVANIFKKDLQNVNTTENKLKNLSERELEIARLIAQGYSNKDISKMLFISEGTVRNYISTILEKLELKNRTQIAIYYLSNSLPF
ncbi:two component transcriptional regulator, LuxR family [Caldicellulosiruptor obsidiansis OB47]|uniref:Two component transcriptional regulator, LuxR family n=1 Tax=Caldicellulosiruptor obsidiansis (strain ATCC BAA-2073 / JCM 16842 / OB47) TaxID=608506 RepID=D9TH79_CALOO|nr:response regulator transcription factor [Caldicellulosiruptor obsidiansis]ADL43476.1 two component transcriptional regulator, LuxR family [Caldicellulosiruptor obsidiansis OB47]